MWRSEGRVRMKAAIILICCLVLIPLQPVGVIGQQQERGPVQVPAAPPLWTGSIPSEPVAAELTTEGHWEQLPFPLGCIVYFIAIDRNNSQILYAGDFGGGVWKTTNGGASWSDSSSGLTDKHMVSMAIDPNNTQTLYTGTWGGGINASGIFKSTNGGVSWAYTSSGLGSSDFESLVINPSDSQTIYAGLDGGGVYKSTNGGASWADFSSGLTSFWVQTLAIDPVNSQTLYAGFYLGGVCKSTNGGANWADSSSGLPNSSVNWLAVDPSNSQTLYAVVNSNDGVFKSTNGGASWSSFSSGLPLYNVWCLAIDPGNSQILYAGTQDGVFKSTNGGASWSSFSSGMTNGWVKSLAIDPNYSQTLYAGTDGNGVFKWIPGSVSSISLTAPNGGESWGIGSSHAITWTSQGVSGNVKIEINRNYPSGTWDTLFSSVANDGSESWVVTSPASTTCRMRISSVSDPSIQDTSDGNFIVVATSLSLTAPNGGESWGIGSSHAITWTFTNLTGNIKLELSRDGGSTYPETLVAPVPVSAGSYNWTVSGPASTTCRVKVTSVSDPSLFDSSDSDFFVSEWAWSQILPISATPSWQSGYAYAFDKPRDRLILFKTDSPTVKETWMFSFQDNRWSLLHPSTSPNALNGYSLTYDEYNQRMILFGGHDNGGYYCLNETWAFNCSTNEWEQLHPLHAPSPRYAHSIVYDPEHQRLVLFGGYFWEKDDTWVFDCNTNDWTELTPTNHPSQRAEQAMAYEPTQRKIILFGGGSGWSPDVRQDTWSFDCDTNQWTQLFPSHSPSARRWHCMTQGLVSGQVLLFGGCSFPSGTPEGTPLNDTWGYDLNRNDWVTLSTVVSPSLRCNTPYLAYDGNRNRAILFGGFSTVSSIHANDLWVFQTSSTSPLQLTYPNGGESWPISSTQTINWTSTDLAGNLAIILSRDGGLTYTESLSTISATVGSNVWTVTGPASTTCRIKVTSVDNPSAFDSSDGNFVIFDLSPTHTATYALQPNWNMISLPLVPASTDPQVVFSGLPSPWYLFEWDPLAGTYIGKELISLRLGAGYWLRVPTAVAYPVSGQLNGEAQTGIDLGLGWNLIGVPYEGTIPWGAVRVSKDGGALVTLDQAVSSNWIQGMFFHWNGSAYELIITGGSFQSLFGFWLKAKVTGLRLVFLSDLPPPPPPGAAVSFP